MVICVVCPHSFLHVVRFAADRLRARPIGFSVCVSMVPIFAGLLWELNPGPLAPEARIIPLDQAANWRCDVVLGRERGVPWTKIDSRVLRIVVRQFRVRPMCVVVA